MGVGENEAFLSAKYDETEITRQAATNSNDQQNAAIRSLANRVDNVVKDVDQAMFKLSTNMESLKQNTSGSAAASEDMKTCIDEFRSWRTPNRTPSETVTCPVTPPAQDQPPLPVPQLCNIVREIAQENLCNTVREIAQENRRQIEIGDNTIISGLPEKDNELIRTLVPEINPATIEVKQVIWGQTKVNSRKNQCRYEGAPHEKPFWPEAWCT